MKKIFYTLFSGLLLGFPFLAKAGAGESSNFADHSGMMGALGGNMLFGWIMQILVLAILVLVIIAIIKYINYYGIRI